MGNTRNTGYLQNIVLYDENDNITLPARLAVSGTVSINNTTPYDTTQFSLDVNGGLIVKNINKTAQFVLINSNPATGGNNAFVVHTVGGTSGSSYADIQGYYGTSVAGSTVIRLNPLGGNVLVGSLAGTGSRMVVADSTGVLSTQAIVTLGDLSGVPTARTITINGTTQDLSANRTWTLYTDDISEDGSPVNLWFTNARARAAISVTGSGSYDSATGVITVTGGVTSVNTLTGAITLTTSNIAEGTNLYYTQTRFNTAFSGKSTSDLSEGTNLYYTDTRVGTYLTNNNYATQTYVGTAISNLVDAAPGTLDTLNELAAALGDDPNFATSVATSIGTKEPVITAGTTTQYWRGDKTWQTLPIYTLSGLGGVPTTRTITINGTALDLSADRSFTINSMVYPGAGIAVSTGSAWGTSITDNSSNWNTAYGWGNHASAGYLTSVTNITGNAGTVTNGVYTNTNQTITGIKTFQQQGDDIAVTLDNTNTGNATRFRYKKGGTDYWSLDARGSGESDALNLYRYYSGNWYQVVSWNHSNGNATFAGTLSASNLSGTNTGDQTNITGNAATATNVAWTGVTSRPTALSQFTNDLGNYGGWVTSSGTVLGLNTQFLDTGSINVSYGYSTVLRNENGAGAVLNYSPTLHISASDTMWQLQGTYGTSGNGTLYFRQGYAGSWGTWLTMISSANISSQPVVTIQDAAPSGSAGRLWWESDTGKLKVYYGSAWVDASPIPDSSLFFAKAGGSITGDVSIGQTLNVVGNTLVQGNINAFGDITAYSSSDARLKDNITVIESPLEKLSKINGVSFNWNDKQTAYEVGKKDIGVIAQEIEEVLPELVTTRDNGYKAVRYEKIVALLIEAVKEQQTQINNLTDKLNNL